MPDPTSSTGDPDADAMLSGAQAPSSSGVAPVITGDPDADSMLHGASSMDSGAVSGKEAVRRLIENRVTGGAASVAGGLRSVYDLTLGGKTVAQTDQRYQQFVKDNTYNPSDTASQGLVGAYDKGQQYNPLALPAKALYKGGDLLNKVLGTTDVGPIAAGVVQGAAGLAGLKSGVGKMTAPTTTMADDAIAQGQKLGYVVPPSMTNPSLLNKTLEGVAGKFSTAQLAAMKNQQVTNGLIRQEFNLPEGTPLDTDTMNQIRQAQSPAYDAIKAVPDIQFGPAYEAELNKLTGTSSKITAALPNYKSTGAGQVQDLVDSLKPQGGKMDGDVAVELSKSLRSEASSYETAAARSGDPQAKTLARAYRGAGEAVENAIEQHLNNIGQPDLAGQWDTARRNIAKTYSVQNALDGVGNVDATKLGKQLIKGKPLSGNLEAAANFANAAPKVARNLKETSPGMSPLDVFGGAAIEAATGNPAALAIGPARMAARSALLGPLGQWMSKKMPFRGPASNTGTKQAMGVPPLIAAPVTPKENQDDR